MPRSSPGTPHLPNKTERTFAQVLALKKLPAQARQLLLHLRDCLGGRLSDCPECLDRGLVPVDPKDGTGWVVCPECAKREREERERQ